MLVRTVKVGKDEWLLLRRPFETKFLHGIPPTQLVKRIPENNYLLVKIKNDIVTERHWSNEFVELRDLMAKRTAQMTGKRTAQMTGKRTAQMTGNTELQMKRKLFSMNKRHQEPSYRKRKHMDAEKLRVAHNTPR